MPICCCQSSGCAAAGGRDITKRLYDCHARLERSTQVLNAQAASRNALQEQEEVLASYLTTLTLSDQVSGMTSLPGGRLWSKSSSHEDPTKDTPSKPTFSRRELIEHDLKRIRDLEKSLGAVQSEATSKLPSVGSPLERTTPFPLTALIAAAQDILDQLHHIKQKAPSVQQSKAPIVFQTQELLANLRQSQRQWRDQAMISPIEVIPDSPYELNADHHYHPILQGVDPIIQISVFLMVAMQVVLHVSRRGCRFLLAMIQYIVHLSLGRKDATLSMRDEKLLADFPSDPATATAKFCLEGKSTILAVCPNGKCHKTYKPTFLGGSPIPVYPKHCTHKQYLNGDRCGERLTRPCCIQGVDAEVPIKTFVSFDFKDWIAGILSRPGYEDRMDAAWAERSKDETMQDIFHGGYVKGFKGPDGKLFSLGGDEGRYIFSMSVDFFNPYTNKQAGKKSSVGLISVVCLNLPPSMRYKPENMFLAGVIPGPKEPPLTTLNHYLEPLIDDLVDFWQTGVKFSRTSNCSTGRLIRCALLVLVCDLPGARKTAGFASSAHEHFCSVCHCTRSEHGYDDLKYHLWRRRTNNECRSFANRFQAAGSEQDRENIFKASGVRWSELLRLPYFDISRCVVVDSMHNLFLGLIKEHFSGILGIELARETEERVLTVTLSDAPGDFSLPERKSVEKLRKWLEAPAAKVFSSDRGQALKKLKTLHLRALRFACDQLHCTLPPPLSHGAAYPKGIVAAAILDWRLAQQETREKGAETSTRHGHVLTAQELEEIRSDIKTLMAPTWLTSVPSNLGDSAHGKLKADQWRALGTTHLPLSLTRLWAFTSSGTPRSLRCREILDVTISLLSAVTIASSRTVSPSGADSYLQHMQAYLAGLKQLFPEYKFHPNHHMALHLHEYLLLFGPVHAWWTFPFERMIGMLQRMQTNSKIGELEETMAKSYVRSANLRALASKWGCPEVIQNCQLIFQKMVDPQLRGTLTTDIRSISLLFEDDNEDDEMPFWNGRTARPIPQELRAALSRCCYVLPRTAQFLPNITIKGLMYAPYRKHRGNSCILFAQSHGKLVPARIETIFQIESADSIQTLIAVRRHLPSQVANDPLLQFPILRAQLWASQVADLEIIQPEQVSSHFACLFMSDDQKTIAVLSLSRKFP